MELMSSLNVPIYNPVKSTGDKLYFTPSAIKHIKKILARSGEKCFRLSIKRSGCSGFTYVADYITSSHPGDLEFPIDDDLAVFVEPISFPILKGTHIDYVQEGLIGKLKFNNPNQIASCGCGESFSIEEK